MRLLLRSRCLFSSVPSWATIDPWAVSGSKPHTVTQILDGKSFKATSSVAIPDPLNGEKFMNISHPSSNAELDAFI